MTDAQPVKDSQKLMWSLGDYRELARQFEPTAVALVEACGIGPGMEVLEVAAGTGNLAVAAARRGARVVASDLTPRMVELGRERSAAEGLDIEWREADAEDLPFPDNSFDVVLSTCGAMFAPDQERTAGELLRVCRPGGRIGMVNWVPDGYVGALFRTIGRYLPPPPGVRPPVQWGSEERLRELFGPEVTISAPRRTFLWRWPSPEHQAEYFATFYGPTNKALAALSPDQAAALKADMVEVARSFDVSDDDTLVLRQDYLEPVIRKP
jgi:SAM-dependent methyltransferase